MPDPNQGHANPALDLIHRFMYYQDGKYTPDKDVNGGDLVDVVNDAMRAAGLIPESD